jgi:mannonate dehydratase
MEMTFRWFGDDDPVRLSAIRQIPGVTGIVSALYDVPVGSPWSASRVAQLQDTIHDAGLGLAVIESIPVHEDIKLGRPTRERYAAAFAASLEALGACGVRVLCYNFMPIFDWTRTSLAAPQPDGSTALAYDDEALAAIDLSHGTGDLPGWATAYDAATLGALRAAYAAVSAERLWEHLHWFLEQLSPVAESAGVRLALHPDDPPWPIFGLPRIVTTGDALTRVTRLVDSPANGVTFCTGSLGARADNDLPAIVRSLGARIHFVHARNVKRTAPRVFHESRHPSRYGDVDMRAVLAALRDVGFAGPMRPDHGRMIWGETGRAGYGLYDRALGATYLTGLWEGLTTTG